MTKFLPIILLCIAFQSFGQVKKDIESVAFYKLTYLHDISADGRFSLFYDYAGVLRVVERENGREIAQLAVRASYPIRFIPGTTKVIYSEYKEVKPFGNESKIWDFQSGKNELCLDVKKNVYSPAFVDGNTAFGTIDDENKSLGSLLTKVNLSNCQTEVIGRIHPLDQNNRLRTNTIPGSGIKISPDRKLLAYSLDSNDKIIFRNTEKPEQIAQEINAAPLYFWSEQRFSPDGKFLITNAADRNQFLGIKENDNYYLLIYDLKSFRQIKQIIIPVSGDVTISAVATIAISPDSRFVAASYKTVKKGFWGNIEQPYVIIYEITTGKEVGKLSHPPRKEKQLPYWNDIGTLMFTTDGKYLITTAGSGTYVWDLKNLSNSVN